MDTPTAWQEVIFGLCHDGDQTAMASHLKESEGSTPSVAGLMNQLRQKPWAPSSGSTLRSLETVSTYHFE